MKQCYKDPNRPCNDECAAYSEKARHGTHCLELASRLEANERIQQTQFATEVNSLYMKILAESMNDFRQTIGEVFD